MSSPEQYWIDRGKDLIGLDVLALGEDARQARTYQAIAIEAQNSSSRVLDVGCNVGALEMFIRMQEEDVGVKGALCPDISYFGVDSNPAAVEFCRKKGLSVMLGSLRDLRAEARFGCVVVKDVLEHLESLEPARNAFKFASKTVILSFFIPPVPDGPLVIMQTKNGYYHNQYLEKDLLALASDCGFDMVKRIDTWETDGNMNRTYVFERRKG